MTVLDAGAGGTARPEPGDAGSELREMERMRTHLLSRYEGSVSPPVIEEAIAAAEARFREASVRQFVPLLVERSVRRSLKGRLHDTAGGSGRGP